MYRSHLPNYKRLALARVIGKPHWRDYFVYGPPLTELASFALCVSVAAGTGDKLDNPASPTQNLKWRIRIRQFHLLGLTALDSDQGLCQKKGAPLRPAARACRWEEISISAITTRCRRFTA